MNSNPLLTVFTPTYNRAHLLPLLYESLCKQTFKNFEWVVVDDGSKDHTKEVLASFAQDEQAFFMALGRQRVNYSSFLTVMTNYLLMHWRM